MIESLCTGLREVIEKTLAKSPGEIPFWLFIQEVESFVLLHALSLTKTKKAAAELLRMNRTTFTEKVKKYYPHLVETPVKKPPIPKFNRR